MPPAREAFLAAHHAREELVYLGDLVFYSYLERLESGPRPLVSCAEMPTGSISAARIAGCEGSTCKGA